MNRVTQDAMLAAIHVPCPVCGAGPGQPCTMPRARRRARGYAKMHLRRGRAVEQLRRDHA